MHCVLARAQARVREEEYSVLNVLFVLRKPQPSVVTGVAACVDHRASRPTNVLIVLRPESELALASISRVGFVLTLLEVVQDAL